MEDGGWRNGRGKKGRVRKVEQGAAEPGPSLNNSAKDFKKYNCNYERSIISA